jgi:hypothetical protein
MPVSTGIIEATENVCAEPGAAADAIVAQVDWMVAEFGNPDGFDSRQWVNRWPDLYVPHWAELCRAVCSVLTTGVDW